MKRAVFLVLSIVFFAKPLWAERWHQVSAHRFGVIKSLLRSQGMATDDKGRFWFSSRQTLVRAKSPGGNAEKMNLLPFAKSLKARKANHIGDITYSNGVLFLPIEDGPKYNHPVIAKYNPETLKAMAFYDLERDWQPDGVPWVAADATSGSVFSSQYNNVTAINVYDYDTLKKVRQISMSEMIDSIQGAKYRDGSLYLSADAKTKGKFAIYKLDLSTGHVEPVADLEDDLHEVEGLEFTGSGENLRLNVLGVAGSGFNRRVKFYEFEIAEK